MRPFFYFLLVITSYSLNGQRYNIFAPRDYALPAKNFSIGASFRTLTGKALFDDISTLPLNVSTAEAVLDKGVIFPNHPLQIGVKMQRWFHPRFGMGVEIFWDYHREVVHYNSQRNLRIVIPAKKEGESLGIRFNLQTRFRIGSVWLKPSILGGATWQSHGLHFKMSQWQTGPGQTSRFITVGNELDFLAFHLFHLMFYGAGVETLLFAWSGEKHHHLIGLELLAQRYWQAPVEYFISYEEDPSSAFGNNYKVIAKGGACWTFAAGLNYSFY